MRLVGASDAFIRWPFIFEARSSDSWGRRPRSPSLRSSRGRCPTSCTASSGPADRARLAPDRHGAARRGDGVRVASSVVALGAELPDQVGRHPDCPDAPPRPPVYAVGPASRVPGCADPEHENTSMTARGPEPDPLDPPTTTCPPSRTPSPRAGRRARRAGRRARQPARSSSPPARGRVGALPLALAAVAVLAGAALSCPATCSNADGHHAGHARCRRGAVRAVLGYVGLDHPELRRSGRPEDDRRGAIDGMIKALGDPYSAYMSSAASRARAIPLQASSRGSAPP